MGWVALRPGTADRAGRARAGVVAALPTSEKHICSNRRAGPRVPVGPGGRGAIDRRPGRRPLRRARRCRGGAGGQGGA